MNRLISNNVTFTATTQSLQAVKVFFRGQTDGRPDGLSDHCIDSQFFVRVKNTTTEQAFSCLGSWLQYRIFTKRRHRNVRRTSQPHLGTMTRQSHTVNHLRSGLVLSGILVISTVEPYSTNTFFTFFYSSHETLRQNQFTHTVRLFTFSTSAKLLRSQARSRFPLIRG